MKGLINMIRTVVGILFIISGAVKANDPHGLAYKMDEFFETWASSGFLPHLMNWIQRFSLEFSIVMISLEVIVGLGLLLGEWKKFFVWATLILMIFFTWLTGYAALSGKIATCGCFGDCLPLTSMQSFIKDIVLLALAIVLVLGMKWIRPRMAMASNVLILLLGVFAVAGFQWYVLKNLPLVDCLPFKVGNDILELRKMPADAVPDKIDYHFIYEKGGNQKEFTIRDLPDSTWTFVNRKDVVVQKGSNNEPPIKDYILMTPSGEDTTQSVLSLDADYYLFYVKDVMNTSRRWSKTFNKIFSLAQEEKRPLLVVSADPEGAQQYFNQKYQLHLPILSLDATSFKTVARTNPELYLMHGPVVKAKWAGDSLDKAVQK
ncbi:MAG: DoxX family membrane protein [Chitinophagaceae bacterium]|nr:DoxX family membrane protein [Chitinophagaceae bacterium]